MVKATVFLINPASPIVVAAPPMKCLDPKEYTVGWICALHIELAAAQCMLDEAHENSFSQDAQDKNNYVLGRIGSHNVVLAGLPSRKQEPSLPVPRRCQCCRRFRQSGMDSV